MGEENAPAGGLSEPAGMIGQQAVAGWPTGYRYGVTRYADIILREAFPQRFHDPQETLERFHIDIDELTRGGGSHATRTIRLCPRILRRLLLTTGISRHAEVDLVGERW